MAYWMHAIAIGLVGIIGLAATFLGPSGLASQAADVGGLVVPFWILQAAVIVAAASGAMLALLPGLDRRGKTRPTDEQPA